MTPPQARGPEPEMHADGYANEVSQTAGVAPGPSDTKREFRRPLAKDRDKTLSAIKPWETEGMSRASWYRRKKEQGK